VVFEMESLFRGEVKFEVTSTCCHVGATGAGFENGPSSSNLSSVPQPGARRSTTKLGLRSGKNGKSSDEVGADQLLCSFWLHTHLVEMDQSKLDILDQAEFDDEADDFSKSLVVVLRRVDVDPSSEYVPLHAFSPSFEIQLTLELEYLVDVTGMGRKSHKELEGPCGTGFDTGMQSSTRSDLKWLQWALSKLWPRIKAAVVTKVQREVEPAIAAQFADIGFFGQKFAMNALDLGAEPPRFEAIQVFLQRGEVEFVVPFYWDSCVDIRAQIGPVQAGMNWLRLSGQLCGRFVTVDEIPVMTGVHLFFPDAPKLDFSCTGQVAEMANLDQIRRMIARIVDGAVSQVMVLPNVVRLDWSPDVVEAGFDNLTQEGFPPISVVRFSIRRIRGVKPGVGHSHARVRLGAAICVCNAVSADTGTQTVPEEFDVMLFDERQEMSFQVIVRDSAALGEQCSLAGGSRRARAEDTARHGRVCAHGTARMSELFGDALNCRAGHDQLSQRSSSKASCWLPLTCSCGAVDSCTNKIDIFLEAHLLSLNVDPTHIVSRVKDEAKAGDGRVMPAGESFPGFVPAGLSVGSWTTADPAASLQRTLVEKVETALELVLQLPDQSAGENAAGVVAVVACTLKAIRVPEHLACSLKATLRVGDRSCSKNCVKKEFIHPYGVPQQVCDIVRRLGSESDSGKAPLGTEKIAELTKLSPLIVDAILNHARGFCAALPGFLLLPLYAEDILVGRKFSDLEILLSSTGASAIDPVFAKRRINIRDLIAAYDVYINERSSKRARSSSPRRGDRKIATPKSRNFPSLRTPSPLGGESSANASDAIAVEVDAEIDGKIRNWQWHDLVSFSQQQGFEMSWQSLGNLQSCSWNPWRQEELAEPPSPLEGAQATEAQALAQCGLQLFYVHEPDPSDDCADVAAEQVVPPHPGLAERLSFFV